jgi:hypothetical protein
LVPSGSALATENHFTKQQAAMVIEPEGTKPFISVGRKTLQQAKLASEFPIGLANCVSHFFASVTRLPEIINLREKKLYFG